jgi:cell division protein FtsL
MSTNTYKNVERGNSISIFQAVERLFGKESFIMNGITVHVAPIALFLILMGLVYIGITHSAERMIREHDHLKQEVDDLRTDYTTLKADFMYSSKQSEVARRVKSIGLIESHKPPYKIQLKKD